jgi:hypothetical protein
MKSLLEHKLNTIWMELWNTLIAKTTSKQFGTMLASFLFVCPKVLVHQLVPFY